MDGELNNDSQFGNKRGAAGPDYRHSGGMPMQGQYRNGGAQVSL